MKLIVSFCAALLLLANSALATSVTSSCESSLNVAGDMSTGRDALSEICYTQHKAAANSDYTFLKWTGYWLDNTNKYMQPVTSWSAALNSDVDTTSTESGWRLPTIKELMLLADYSTVFDDSDASKVFANNWMVQQWLLRSSAMGSDLIAHGDAYLLSSTYVNDGSNKFMAMHINTGEVKAIDFSNMPAGDSYYVVKVKEEEPTWESYYVGRHGTGYCLAPSSSGYLMDNCSAGVVDNFRWLYEQNTGFMRHYSGNCIKVADDGYNNGDELVIGECKTGTLAGQEHSARWRRAYYSIGGGYVFESYNTADFYFYAFSGSSRIIKIWNYGSIAFDNQNTFILK